MNLDNLKSLSREQLIETAGKLGLQIHWKAKPETIIKQITQKAFEKPQSKQSMEHVAEKPQAPVIHNTPETVLNAIKHITDKKPEFVADFSEEGVWHFKYKGAEECGNLSIPLRLIVQKANNVARGRLMVRGMEGFERISNTPNNAYTGAVLAG